MKKLLVVLIKTLELNPRYYQAFVNRDRAKATLRQYQRHLKTLTPAIRLKPGDINSLISRGAIYMIYSKQKN